MAYTNVVANSLESLDDKVTRMERLGWRPKGAVAITTKSSAVIGTQKYLDNDTTILVEGIVYDLLFVQSMVTIEPDAEKIDKYNDPTC